MSWWGLPDKEQKRLEQAGVDYDLHACLDYNPQGTFEVTDIEEVLAVWEGENDGDDWRWLIRLFANVGKKHGGRYVALTGGCDYTGWDCQSWANSSHHRTKWQALASFEEDKAQVLASLREQVRGAKRKTWREQTEKDMGLR